MARLQPARRLVIGATLAVALLGACGGGGSKPSPPATPAAPGANVDPNANGTFTGPINKAKTTATNLSNQQNQLNQSTGN